MWVAATDAALDNGPLYVVPGSHREPVHAHVADRRPNANLGYYEIIDYDLSAAVAVEMQPGDVLLFDSHLMHFSTDNRVRPPPGRDGVPLRPRRNGRPHRRTPRLLDQRLDAGAAIIVDSTRVMAYPRDEIAAAIERYIAVRDEINAGKRPWRDLAQFFTDDAVFIDPAWGGCRASTR